MKKLRALIVDDEANAREALSKMLEIIAPEVEILDTAKNAEQALQLISEKKPNLVFLDIQMPGKSGFELLAQFQKLDFGVIFTTAYQEYAIKAFRFSAIDYLLKPIDPDLLIESIEKFKNSDYYLKNEQIEILQDHMALPQSTAKEKRLENKGQRLALSTIEGVHLINLTDIIQCESLGSYTKFHLVNGPKIVVSKALKEYEEILDQYQFFRVHQSNIINLEYIKKYVKGDGGQVWMTDNTEIEVSRRRKDEFLELLSGYYINSGRVV